jgi:alpha-beta hydrolase superfamily lysophospholipase
MGGAEVARAVTGGLIAPRGVVLSSPALVTRMNPAMRLAVRIGAVLTPNLRQPHRLPLDKVSHDASVVADIKRDPLNHDKATPRLVQFLVDAGAAARRDASALRTRTLLQVAGDDRLVDPRGSRELADAAPADVLTLHWYEGLWHEIYNEAEPARSRVLADLRDWFERELARP